MRHNLIDRLKEEWNNLDPVDPLRGLISDAIDALQRKPLTDELNQIEKDLRFHGLTLVKTVTGYAVLKLGQITAHGITGEQK